MLYSSAWLHSCISQKCTNIRSALYTAIENIINPKNPCSLPFESNAPGSFFCASVSFSFPDRGPLTLQAQGASVKGEALLMVAQTFLAHEVSRKFFLNSTSIRNLRNIILEGRRKPHIQLRSPAKMGRERNRNRGFHRLSKIRFLRFRLLQQKDDIFPSS